MGRSSSVKPQVGEGGAAQGTDVHPRDRGVARRSGVFPGDRYPELLRVDVLPLLGM